jgi:hypothetical protein
MEGWDYVFSYTRKQAIEDGVLIEVPETIWRSAGIKYPIVCTSSVFAVLDQKNLTNEFRNLLLTMALAALNSKKVSDRANFIFKKENMYAVCHAGDDGFTPVLTIMLVGED